MATDKPQIAILMAVHNPRMDWLQIQLDSLNTQTYPNLRLYLRDDCSNKVSLGEIEKLVAECITAFPYTLVRNEQNLSSNGTFELLTQEAEGDLFAYCDQDDQWLPEKLMRLATAMTPEHSMAYCDMSVMDGEGRTTAQSLRQVRPRLRYVQGRNLAEVYFFRNCSAGCTTLVRAATAKRAVPFPRETVCDQWVAIAAALDGAIAFVDQPLQRYRIHGGNQTGILSGVTSKETYYARRILPLQERLACYRCLAQPSKALESFVSARLNGKLGPLLRYRAFSPMEANFELAMRALPRPLFCAFVRCISK